MSHSSDLITSGLLYEGNFDEWLPRMRAILSQQHGCAITSGDGQPLSVVGGTNRKEVADTIWWQASPYVRARVPESSRSDPNSLIRALREVARPFRFGDLTVEIRSWIYLFVGPSPTFAFATLAMKPNQPARMWCREKDQGSVLCVNRQIRAEALFLYHKTRHFCLMWRDADYPLNTVQQTSSATGRARRVKRDHGDLGLKIAKSLDGWASALRPDTLRCLRTVALFLGFRPRVQMLFFHLETVNGKLEIECSEHAWLSRESKSLLREHAATVSGVAHALKLEGKALMLFLTSRPEIWDRLPELQE